MNRHRYVAATALTAALCLSGTTYARQAPARIGLAARDGVRLYSRPDSKSHVLARIVEQTQLSIVGQHPGWDAVTFWSGIHGWVRASDVAFRSPAATQSTYRAPDVHSSIHAHVRVDVTASATILGPVRTSRGVAIPTGHVVRVDAWKQDVRGTMWYHAPQWGWLPGENVRFAPAHADRRAAALVAGKGMWVTVGTMADSDPHVLISAAHRAGVTHLYLESAISPLGFHGRAVVGPVIEAAHRQGLAVVAWVYPYLIDIASDVDLSRAVSRYTTAHGQHFDGIAADLERNVELPHVRAYSQLLRASLLRVPLIAVTYPPQSLPDFAFAEVARQFDVIAPMDYWHDSRSGFGTLYGHRKYGKEYARLFAAESITEIRAATGSVPVAPIGQTFDNFGRLEMGPYAPSAAEIQGFLTGCKQSGAVGASFFQWMSATEPEWRTIGTFQY